MAGSLRVTVDARPLDLELTRTQGIGRYADGLLRELPAVAADNGGELILLRSRGDGSSVFGPGAGSGARVRAVRRPRLPNRLAEVAEQVLIPLDVRRVGARVHHSLTIYRAPVWPGAAGVMTVHDVIPLMWPHEYFRTGLLHRMLYAAARRCRRLIVPSRAVRDDVIEYLGVPDERLALIYEAAGRAFKPSDPADARARFDLEGPYVLYVGGMTQPDPRKELELLIDSFASWSRERGREETLLLAGRLGAGGRPVVERVRRLGARARFLDFVPNAQLPSLYSGARCLVTATRYEGFGLPALEALSCGTPVAFFDGTGALPEVAGPGALTAPMGDAAALMAAVERLCDDEQLRARLSAAGLEHARRFSWRTAAEQTWAAYESAA